jgi:hypothetical protein
MAKPKKPKVKTKPPAGMEQIAVEMNYRTPDSMRLAYANQLIVQHDENTFFLSYLEALPPVLMGTVEERMSQLKSLGSLAAHCVAKIAIPVNQMEKIVEVLTGNLQQHKDSMAMIKAHKASQGGSSNGKE